MEKERIAYGSPASVYGQPEGEPERRRVLAEREKQRRRQLQLRRRKRRRVMSAAVASAVVVGILLWNLPQWLDGASSSRISGGADLSTGADTPQLEALKALEPEYPELSSVIGNIQDYAQGAVELFLNNQESIEYLLDYPQESGKKHRMKIAEDLREADKIPLFIQWDERWGYEPYGSGLIGWTGCGPTCLSMAVVGLTGKERWNPAEVAEFSEERGYYTVNAGTSWDFMTQGAEELGLSSSELPLQESRIRSVLDEGGVVICSVGPGDFTTEGHYILIRDYDENGFLVNDPNSRQRSAMEWSYERLAPQIKNLWALYA